jgi:hypothetical protein
MNQFDDSSTFRERLGDFYLDWPLICDALIALIVVLALHFGAKYVPLDAISQETVLYNLAVTSITLAGFILTGLTIIVSLRANITVRGLKEARSGLELLFNSTHYEKVVRVFKQAIQYLVLGGVILFGTMFFAGNMTERHALLIAAVGLLEIVLAVWRCLRVLFAIVQLEVKSRKQQEDNAESK